MLKTKLTEMLGIKHPIIQAGMGPFSNNNLCVAAANAGALGLLSTSGLFNKAESPWIYNAFVETAEASMDDDMATVLEKVLKRTSRLTRDRGGIFGINVMVSSELLDKSEILIDTAIRVREENPEIKNQFKVIFTSAGDPVPWQNKIKSAGFTLAPYRSLREGRSTLQKSGGRLHHCLRARRRLPYLLGANPLHGFAARGDRRHCRSKFPCGWRGWFLRQQDIGGGAFHGCVGRTDGNKIFGNSGE